MHQPSLCEQDMHEQGACGKGFCYAGSCMWHCVALSPHGLASCCLFVSATLVHRCPDVRWLFWFPANVRIAVLITAQCPGLWLRSCAAVCCRSPSPLSASSPSQRLHVLLRWFAEVLMSDGYSGSRLMSVLLS